MNNTNRDAHHNGEQMAEKSKEQKITHGTLIHHEEEADSVDKYFSADHTAEGLFADEESPDILSAEEDLTIEDEDELGKAGE